MDIITELPRDTIKRGRGPGRKPHKVYLSARFEADEVAWLRAQGVNVSKTLRKLVRDAMNKTEAV